MFSRFLLAIALAVLGTLAGILAASGNEPSQWLGGIFSIFFGIWAVITFFDDDEKSSFASTGQVFYLWPATFPLFFAGANMYCTIVQHVCWC